MYMYEFSGARKEANKRGREIRGERNEDRQLERRKGKGGVDYRRNEGSRGIAKGLVG